MCPWSINEIVREECPQESRYVSTGQEKEKRKSHIDHLDSERLIPFVLEERLIQADPRSGHAVRRM